MTLEDKLLQYVLRILPIFALTAALSAASISYTFNPLSGSSGAPLPTCTASSSTNGSTLTLSLSSCNSGGNPLTHTSFNLTATELPFTVAFGGLDDPFVHDFFGHEWNFDVQGAATYTGFLTPSGNYLDFDVSCSCLNFTEAFFP
jgi:hypothetical protein